MMAPLFLVAQVASITSTMAVSQPGIMQMALVRRSAEEYPKSSSIRRALTHRNRSISRWLEAEDNGATVPLFPGLGTHFVDVYVGTPPQRQSVIVDTGSPLTAFTCMPGCDEERCGKHTDPFYDMAHSKTASRLSCSECRTQCLNGKCEISQRYSEGSAWSAYLVRDQLWIGGSKPQGPPSGANKYAIDFVFGCQTKLTGLFIPQKENGIMGLSSGEDNIMRQLKKAGKVDRTVFGLCFTSNGGTMTLGGVVDDFHAAPMTYVPLSTSRNGWYLVKVKSITLSQSMVAGQDAWALLDSGTTDTYLLKSSGTTFMALFQQMTGFKYAAGETYYLSAYELMELPSVIFTLAEGLTLEMTPDKYMEPQGKDAYVPRIYFSERSLPILGANLLSGYDVAFDLDAQRVGIARARCDFSNTETRERCSCGQERGSPVCGADGLTYMSQCFAECHHVPVLWKGACPKRIPERCRAVLFSPKMKGCAEIAQVVFQNNGSTAAADLCNNPCWQTATTACEGLHYEEMRVRLDVTPDFCAVSDLGGAYCRDLHRKDKVDCDSLRATGCCFHHLMGILTPSENEQLRASQCHATTPSRCHLTHQRPRPNPLRRRPHSRVSASHTYLRFTTIDIIIIFFISTTFVIFVVGPPWVRDLPRAAWSRLFTRSSQKRYDLLSPTRRNGPSSAVELESVRLKHDVDDPTSS